MTDATKAYSLGFFLVLKTREGVHTRLDLDGVAAPAGSWIARDDGPAAATLTIDGDEQPLPYVFTGRGDSNHGVSGDGESGGSTPGGGARFRSSSSRAENTDRLTIENVQVSAGQRLIVLVAGGDRMPLKSAVFAGAKLAPLVRESGRYAIAETAVLTAKPGSSIAGDVVVTLSQPVSHAVATAVVFEGEIVQAILQPAEQLTVKDARQGNYLLLAVATRYRCENPQFYPGIGVFPGRDRIDFLPIVHSGDLAIGYQVNGSASVAAVEVTVE